MRTNGGSKNTGARTEARPRPSRRTLIFRLIGLADLALGIIYLSWRYYASLNPSALVLAIVLVAAETFAFIDTVLFVVMMWKPVARESPPAPASASVDVFITTYNEPVELVRTTAAAATRIDWSSLAVHILDDGARPEMEVLAAELGCGYISRGPEWVGKARHAKAGNVNNALLKTSADFILILDADQIPAPGIVRRTLGYFDDPAVAFVQTPQSFYNTPPGDPLGTDAPLFYGPIMQGKDGWNAAFFCGSNAVLRREALLMIGLANYSESVEREFLGSIDALRMASRPKLGDSERELVAKRTLRAVVDRVQGELRAGASLEKVAVLARAAAKEFREGYACVEADEADRRLEAVCAKGQVAPLVTKGLSLSRQDEALAVQALSTVSVTEDMATALRLHSSGWKSVFHPEVLAYGLAPEDLGSALSQRLRWAQGTIQVLFRESPLSKKGLTFGQRLMYFATMYSYFSGFSNLVFVAAPLFYFFLGLSPVAAWSVDFFARFLPFYLLNRFMFVFVAWGIPVKRGEQYNLALFPLWIKAVTSVLFGRKISFAVTPKQRQ
ncbi:MAG: glycosyltransferase, partial [Spirochaetaceae bacterium]|nr:glycosyltransferase [Spirochaetaceae bacterium]